MKTRCFIIGSIVLLAFSACHTPTREAKHMVARAELLADTLPDSTIRLIDSVLRMPVSFNEWQRMDMALLQGEVLFRDAELDDDFDFLDSIATSPELERAADYYAKKKQYAKAAHAALYSGYVLQHYNEKEVAMQSFKEAEHYGELVEDCLIIAQARYRMGKLLYYEGRKQEALSAFQFSNTHIGDRYNDLAIIENSKAAVYMLLGQNDSAEICLQQSIFYAQKSHSEKVMHKAMHNYAVLYRQLGKYDLSIKYLRQTAENYYLDDTELFMYHLNMGTTFMVAGIMDSATLYYQRMEDILPQIHIGFETKASAYGALSQFAENQNNDSLALSYQKEVGDLLFEIMRQRQEQNIYRIQRQYDYETLQNAMNQKLARTQRIIAFGVMLLLSIIVLFLFRSSQRNKKEAEANANLFHFMQQNKELVESNMAHEKKVLDTTQQLSNLMYARLMAMQKLDYCLKNPKDKIALKDLEREVFGTGDHWEAVSEVMAALYPGLEETLKLKYPEMDDMELRVCMLSRLKLSRLGESTLLGISTSVLDKLRMKIRKMKD